MVKTIFRHNKVEDELPGVGDCSKSYPEKKHTVPASRLRSGKTSSSRKRR